MYYISVGSQIPLGRGLVFHSAPVEVCDAIADDNAGLMFTQSDGSAVAEREGSPVAAGDHVCGGGKYLLLLVQLLRPEKPKGHRHHKEYGSGTEPGTQRADTR